MIHKWYTNYRSTKPTVKITFNANETAPIILIIRFTLSSTLRLMLRSVLILPRTIANNTSIIRRFKNQTWLYRRLLIFVMNLISFTEARFGFPSKNLRHQTTILIAILDGARGQSQISTHQIVCRPIWKCSTFFKFTPPCIFAFPENGRNNLKSGSTLIWPQKNLNYFFCSVYLPNNNTNQ